MPSDYTLFLAVNDFLVKMLDFHLEHARALTRRQFFCKSGLSLGAVALGGLLSRDGYAGVAPALKSANPLAPRKPHFAPKAKSIIYLDMSGAPPSLDMFDWKPKLAELNLKPCPEELLKGQRFAFIKGVPKMLGSPYKFAQYGSSGAWVSELLPHFTEIVDDVALIRSMWTDQFNHAPAELFIYTGSARAGAASMGSWLTYGLGTENQDLPGFVVLLSGGTDPTGGKSLWGSGFLPSVYQGVQCRSAGEPILFANNPAGMDRASRRRTLDALDKLDEIEAKQFGDPETVTRIAQYELAYRMQISVPEVFDISKEPKDIHEMYGTKPGEASFANNCLLARRLVERGVRHVQLYDWGWDNAGDLGRRIRSHPDERGARRFDVPWPRSSSALFYHLDGRRRHSARRRLRRNRRTRLRRRERQGLRARPANHDPSSDGPRRASTQLPFPGVEPAPDRPRGRRRAGQRDFGLSR